MRSPPSATTMIAHMLDRIDAQLEDKADGIDTSDHILRSFDYRDLVQVQKFLRSFRSYANGASPRIRRHNKWSPGEGLR